MPALPAPEYLQKIGQVAYTVSAVEWLVLGDLAHLTGLPPQLTTGAVAGQPTGRIAIELANRAPHVTDAASQAFISTAGDLLREAQLRNHLLHARPATSGRQQRLFRWRLDLHDTFAIDDDWLSAAQAQLDDASRRLHAVRVPPP